MAIWNSFPSSLMSCTLDRLSIPASMNGLSISSSSSPAMRLAVISITFFCTIAPSRPLGAALATLAPAPAAGAATAPESSPAAICCTCTTWTGGGAIFFSMRSRRSATSACVFVSLMASASSLAVWAKSFASLFWLRASAISPCSTSVCSSPTASSAFLNHLTASSAANCASWKRPVIESRRARARRAAATRTRSPARCESVTASAADLSAFSSGCAPVSGTSSSTPAATKTCVSRSWAQVISLRSSMDCAICFAFATDRSADSKARLSRCTCPTSRKASASRRLLPASWATRTACSAAVCAAPNSPCCMCSSASRPHASPSPRRSLAARKRACACWHLSMA
mmetsp:Transcript_15889/g.41022  ORF Transcript_15889/g.41022 Transcript_15889/m.41022 type:complete len:342 (+) Transcript_15889:148-1173(+)